MNELKLEFIWLKCDMTIYAAGFPWNQKPLKGLIELINGYYSGSPEDRNEVYEWMLDVLRVKRDMAIRIDAKPIVKKCDNNISLINKLRR